MTDTTQQALAATKPGATPASRAFRLFRIGAAISTVVGVALALAVILRFDVVLLALGALAVWPGDASAALSQEAALFGGIAGAVLAGWGATLLGLARQLGEAGLRPIAGLLAAPVILWFLLDGAASWAAGAPLNIVLNLPYLLLLAGPLLALRSAAPR